LPPELSGQTIIFAEFSGIDKSEAGVAKSLAIEPTYRRSVWYQLKRRRTASFCAAVDLNAVLINSSEPEAGHKIRRIE